MTGNRNKVTTDNRQQTTEKRAEFNMHCKVLRNSAVCCQLSAVKQRGFTLLEMLVGIAVFVVITSVVVSVLLSSIRAQRKSVQIQNVADNSRFVLEKISRAVRQSTVLNSPGTTTELKLCHPTLGYPTSTSSVCALSCETKCLDYRFDSANNRIQERSADIEPDTDIDVNDYVSITSSNISIESISFNIIDVGDQQQPRVTILMTAKQAGTATKPEERAEIHLQTTVTPRRLDIQ